MQVNRNRQQSLAIRWILMAVPREEGPADAREAGRRAAGRLQPRRRGRHAARKRPPHGRRQQGLRPLRLVITEHRRSPRAARSGSRRCLARRVGTVLHGLEPCHGSATSSRSCMVELLATIDPCHSLPSRPTLPLTMPHVSRPEHAPQHRHHRPHRCRQDDRHRADALLQRRQAPRGRGRQGHDRDRQRPRRAGARHHHLRGLRHVPLEGRHRQPDRHARPRRFHGRSRAQPARARRRASSSSAPAKGSRPRAKPSGGRPTGTRVPRVAFINKLDREGADFDGVLDGNRQAAGSQSRGRADSRRRRVRRTWPIRSAASST